MIDYFEYRASVLNDFVDNHLMDGKRAKNVYEALIAQYKPTYPTPMNKQKGEMKQPAYFTGIINTIIEANICDLSVDYDPHKLTSLTRNMKPIRTLARRIDGAFPSSVNPVAIWEIKEYYYATTFGSRVADGVYETLLDGMELEELHNNENIKVQHFLMIDGHYTWWGDGKSYLCRIIDMLHMNYVDQVLFGYEVVETLPGIVKGWAELLNKNNTIEKETV